MKKRAKMVAGVACAVLFALVVVWTNLSGGSRKKEDPFPDKRDAPIDEVAYIYVELKGAIRLPGIYKVEKGTRLYEVVLLAGGTTEKADTQGKNQAAPVVDGNTYVFPEVPDEEEPPEQPPKDEDGPVSINTAGKEELVSLPNIGPATAENIIAHREEHGPFERLEDLMDVTGIGRATLDDLEGLITL